MKLNSESIPSSAERSVARIEGCGFDEVVSQTGTPRYDFALLTYSGCY